MQNPPSAETSSTSSPNGVDNDLTGLQIGDLQILRRLGRGGMADVYLAMHRSLGRQVAVKILRASLANDQNYVERFRREARAAAKLSHPNIIQVYDVGQSEGRYFISQEFVDGRNLRETIDRTGPLSLEQAVSVLLGVADALQAASAQGITHRDIKPENIMLSQSGEVKVADFGLARIATPDFHGDLTQVGLTLGTPLYMSPEQVQGKSVDVRSDLYSLGVTMFHLLTGRPPFEADTPLAIAVKHLHDVPPPISSLRMDDHTPAWLDEVIARLMHKEPDRRFKSPGSLIEFLQKNLSELPGGNPLGTLPIRLAATKTLQSVMSAEPKLKRSRMGWIALGLFPLLGLVLGAGLANRRPQPTMTQLLDAEASTFEAKDTVQEQFLEAMRINTAASWQAVWQQFPPEDGLQNRLYAAKARIQLARLYEQQAAHVDSLRVAREVMNDPDLPPHLTAIAMAYCENALRAMNDFDAAAPLRESLQRKFEGLSNDGKDLFRVAVPRSVLDRLEL
ncbi:MAG: serine/threonine-protein kinase [Pirellulaceae bacterium]